MIVNNEKIVQIKGNVKKTAVGTLVQECRIDYPKMTQNG